MDFYYWGRFHEWRQQILLTTTLRVWYASGKMPLELVMPFKATFKSQSAVPILESIGNSGKLASFARSSRRYCLKQRIGFITSLEMLLVQTVAFQSSLQESTCCSYFREHREL